VYDILDVLIPHPAEVFTGTYYATMPNSPRESGVSFDYSTVDPTSWHYQALFSQVVVMQSTSAAIKTCDDLGFAVGGYIATQDGRFYEIISVQQDYSSAQQQAFRMMSVVAGVDFVIRLSEKSNPWGLK
jgi:hypothetical protein